MHAHSLHSTWCLCLQQSLTARRQSHGTRRGLQPLTTPPHLEHEYVERPARKKSQPVTSTTLVRSGGRCAPDAHVVYYTTTPQTFPSEEIHVSHNAESRHLSATYPAPAFAISSASDCLAGQLVRCIDDLHLDHISVPYAVSRLASSACLNTVTRALVRWHGDGGTGKPRGLPSRTTLRAYFDTINVVQGALSQPGKERIEDLVLCCGILGLIEYSLDLRADNYGRKASLVHFNACVKLLSEQTHLEELNRATLYAFDSSLVFMRPCWTGVSSVFESPLFLGAEPAGASISKEPHLCRMLKIAHQLFIILPRLILLVRQASLDGLQDSLIEARGLCCTLAMLEDKESESWLLHQVKIVPTRDADLQILLKHSFAFRSLAELTAAMHYWVSRTILEILCHELSIRGLESTAVDVVPFTHDGTERIRLAKNILMTWEAAFSYPPTGTMPMVLGLPAAWAALRYEDKLWEHPTSMHAEVIVKRLALTYNGWIVGDSVADLNSSADVISGGELSGKMAALFGYDFMPGIT